MTIICILSIIASVIAFSYYFIELHSYFNLRGLLKNIEKGGIALLSELLMLAAIIGVFFVAYLILGELGDSYPGCVYVPLFVILWVLIRGLYLPISFVKNFGSIWKPILFIFIMIGIYKGVIWWVNSMMLEANNLVSAIVFGAILVVFSYYAGSVLCGLLLCACKE